MEAQPDLQCAVFQRTCNISLMLKLILWQVLQPNRSQQIFRTETSDSDHYSFVKFGKEKTKPTKSVRKVWSWKSVKTNF